MNIQDLYKLYLNGNGVTTDSRKVPRGSMFFALKGSSFNGNEFARQALRDGAAYAVVDEEKYAKDKRCLLVENGLKALQDLANRHRNQLKIPFLAITGSNGKTTTKELISAVLRKKYRTLATAGNLNNHIGVPLTILSISKNIQIAVIEMGANKLGDIAELCSIAEPTHGIITNIGKAHIEGFGGFEGVIRGKSELYDYLIRTDGRAFINSKNEILANMGKRFAHPVYYPGEGDFLECELVKADPFVVYRTEDGGETATRLIGKYNFENIAAALCIGKYFEIPLSDANEAVVEYEPANNRSQVLRKGDVEILLDAYNANPSSMKAAIENLAAMKSDRKALIAGDMFELGAATEEEHRKIGELVSEKDFDSVYFCGKNMKSAALACPHSSHFETKDELKKFLSGQSFKGAVVLIKASRGMALEDLAEVIK